MIIAITTARNAPSSIEPMHRFELTTCYCLANGASGVVRSDTLVISGAAGMWVVTWDYARSGETRARAGRSCGSPRKAMCIYACCWCREHITS